MSILGKLGSAAGEGLKSFAGKAGTGFVEGALGKTVGGTIAKNIGSSSSGATTSGKQSAPTGDPNRDLINAVRDLQTDTNKSSAAQQQTNAILYANAELLGNVVGQQVQTNKLLSELLKKDFGYNLSAIGSGGNLSRAFGGNLSRAAGGNLSRAATGSVENLLSRGAGTAASRLAAGSLGRVLLPLIAGGAVGGFAGQMFGQSVNSMLDPLKRMLGYTADNYPGMAKWGKEHSIHRAKSPTLMSMLGMSANASELSDAKIEAKQTIGYDSPQVIFKADKIVFAADKIEGLSVKIAAAVSAGMRGTRGGSTPSGGGGETTPGGGSGSSTGATPTPELKTLGNAPFDKNIQTPSFGGIPGGKGAYQGFGADMSKQSMDADLQAAGKFQQIGPGGAITSGGSLATSSGKGRPSPKQFYNYLISQGASAKEAQMLTSAAMAESNMDPNAKHDDGKGYGLFGHSLDRLNMIGKTWEQQGSMALHELRTSPNARRAKEALDKATTAEEITEAQMHYERPEKYTSDNPRAGRNWSGRLANTKSLMGAPTESPEKVKETKTKPSAPSVSGDMLSPKQTSSAPLPPSRPDTSSSAPTPPSRPRFTGALENLTTRKVKTSTELSQDTSGATPVPGTSRMDIVGRAAQRGTGDHRIKDILTEASKYLPEGYRAEIYSGFRPNDQRFHGRGMANDMRIIGPDGRPIDNYQNPEHFRIYEKFAQNAKKIQMEMHPELERDFRWGGYFSGGKGKYGAMDLMHFDIGGKKYGMLGGSWEKGLTSRQKAIWGGRPSSQGMGSVSRYSLPPIGKERIGETQDKSSIYKSPANPFGIPPQHRDRTSSLRGPRYVADMSSMSDASNDFRNTMPKKVELGGMYSKGVGRSAAYKNAIESYYGKKISDEEFDMLERATHAETDYRQTNPEEAAMIMGTILNRAKEGGGIREVLMAKKQFQSVTGNTGSRKKPAEFKPSREYLQGPQGQRLSDIQSAIISRLPHVPESQKYFTSHEKKYQGLGHHKTVEGYPKHSVHGRTIFNESIHSGPHGSVEYMPPAAKPMDKSVSSGREASNKSFDTLHHQRPQQDIKSAVHGAMSHFMGDRSNDRVKTDHVDRGYKDKADLARLFGNRNFG